MAPNQEDTSSQANAGSADQSAIGTPHPVDNLARENASMRAEIAKQKNELDNLSTTFKTALSLKTRKINELENEVKRMKEEVLKNAGASLREERQPINNRVFDGELPDEILAPGEEKNLNKIVDPKKFDLSHPFWDKVALYYGDITKINVDVIVNPTNVHLSGTEGLSGVIHKAAGYEQLQAECVKHDRPVATGQALMTEACGLRPQIRKIMHCVGPSGRGAVTAEMRDVLESCYRSAIELSEEHGLRSIVFPCIATGIHGYDNMDAARTVLKLLHKYFSEVQNVRMWDRVVLCLFMDVDKLCYKQVITQLVRNPALFDEEEDED